MSATEQLHDRYQRVFQQLDHDGDGVVTGADFKLTASSVINEFGLEPTSPKALLLQDGYAKAWALLRQDLDLNEDGSISPEEFVTATANLAGQQVYRDHVSEVGRAEFAAADLDDDGILSKDEFVRLVKATGPSAENVEAAFMQLDQDGDGQISQEEYVTAWEDYLTSGDPDSAGSQVFARL